MDKVKDIPKDTVSSDAINDEDIIEKVVVEDSFTESADAVVDDNTMALMVGVVVGLLTLLLIYFITKRRSLGRGEYTSNIS